MAAETDPSANYLVRVRAQVMTRDDSTGGWVPMGAGGLSSVSVCKTSKPISPEDDSKSEYLIYGRRIADQTVVLSCAIKKDFQYYKVMPTFHHWHTDDKKFGLTFQTAADARAFDKGVRMVIEDLLDGTGDIPNADMGDDDVFMTLDLPLDSRCSSASSTFSGSAGSNKMSQIATPLTHLDVNASPYSTHTNSHLHCMNFTRSYLPPGGNLNSNYPGSRGKTDVWTKDPLRKDTGLDIEKIDIRRTAELNSYVQLSKDKTPRSEHDYSYPMVESYKPGNHEGLKKPQAFDSFSCQPAPRLPVKGKKKKGWKSGRSTARHQCQYCRETFSEMNNRPGSCEYAPDRVLNCIHTATCISCAQCMVYHCMSDSEGDFNQHPCLCDSSDSHCPRRWCALALLSVFVPCLWCYLPLRACHKCGVKCGVCGGRHQSD